MRLPAAVPALLQHWMSQPHLAAALALPGQAACAGHLWRASSAASQQHQQHAAGSGPAARLMCSSSSSAGGASGVPDQTYLAAAKLTTLGASTTRSGYRESRPASYAQQLGQDGAKAAADDASSTSQASQQQAGERPVDYYRLVRALFADEQVQKAGGVQLDEEAVVVLNKLVGSLTKEGKRSKANRILLDALHLIRESAAKDRAA